MPDNREVLDRLKILLGIKEDKALADRLGISQPALSMWRKRNKLDWQLIIDRFPKIDLNRLAKGAQITSGELQAASNHSDDSDKAAKISSEEMIQLRLDNSRLQGQVDLLKEQLAAKENELMDCLHRTSERSAQLMIDKKDAELRERLRQESDNGPSTSVSSHRASIRKS